MHFGDLYILTKGAQGYAFFADFRPFVKLFEIEKSDPKSHCGSDFAAIIKYKCNNVRLRRMNEVIFTIELYLFLFDFQLSKTK